MMRTIFPVLLFYLLFWGLGEYASKRYADRPRWIWLAAALTAYLINSCTWLLALRRCNALALMGMIFCLTAAMLTVILGLTVFNERLDNVQVAGLVLGFFAMVLLLS